MNPDVLFTMTMDVPEKTGGTRKISFDARSVRCVQDSNPAFYNTGFQFVAIEKEDVKTIKKLIEDFAISD